MNSVGISACFGGMHSFVSRTLVEGKVHVASPATSGGEGEACCQTMMSPHLEAQSSWSRK